MLRGEGRGFSAGADLRSEDLSREDGGAPDLGEYLRRTFSPTVQKISGMHKPVLASLHGPVYGAGVGLALACDLRLAAHSASFSVAFIKIGLMPDAGVSYFLPRVVGLGRAMEMSMLGDAVDADEAQRIGLVNKVVPEDELEKETAALAGRLAAMPTVALARIKHSLCASFGSRPRHGPRGRGRRAVGVRLHLGPRRRPRRLLRQAGAGFHGELGLLLSPISRPRRPGSE